MKRSPLHNLVVAACVGATTLCAGVTSVAHAADNSTIRYDELSRYLATTSQGAIIENPDYAQSCRTPGSTCAEFDLKKSRVGSYWDTQGALPDETIQDFFRFDEARFKENEKAATFATAKERYYARVPFNSKKYTYELPFENLRGWGTLNHPPIKELTAAPGSYLEGLEPIDRTKIDSIYFDEEFQRGLDRLSQTELSAGNQLHVMPGRDAYDKKMDLIKGAKRFLWVQVMVFFCDSESRGLLDAMIERRKAGVEVRLMLEGLWTRIAAEGCLAKMRDNGIDVLLVADSVRHGSFGVMHPKIWIRDGEEGILGGKNIIASEDIGDGFNDGYRDTDIWIKSGPAITDAMDQYADTWQNEQTHNNHSIAKYIPEIAARKASERNAGVRGSNVYSTILRDPVQRMNGVCRVVSQGRAAKVRPISPVLREYAAHAQKRVLLTTPKLRFSKDLSGQKLATDFFFAELQKAGNERGVRVDLISNGSDGQGGDLTKIPRKLRDWARETDHYGLEHFADAIANTMGWFDQGANQNKMDQFVSLSPNFHAWTYFRYAHQKVHVFDRILAGVGSFNLDAHSTVANHEAELFCFDNTLLNEIEAMYARDISNSVPVPSPFR